MFRRVVNVIEALVLVGVAIVVVLLFANEPGSGSGPAATTGAQVYAANCASCHGSDGDGGVGPQLAGGAVVKRFPDVNDQIAFVTDGKGLMPAFGGRLTPAQIRAVVEYTRSL